MQKMDTRLLIIKIIQRLPCGRFLDLNIGAKKLILISISIRNHFRILKKSIQTVIYHIFDYEKEYNDHLRGKNVYQYITYPTYINNVYIDCCDKCTTFKPGSLYNFVMFHYAYECGCTWHYIHLGFIDPRPIVIKDIDPCLSGRLLSHGGDYPGMLSMPEIAHALFKSKWKARIDCMSERSLFRRRLYKYLREGRAGIKFELIGVAYQ